MEDDDLGIQYPPGFGRQDVLAWGGTGLIILDLTTHSVIKTPLAAEDRCLIQREREIYERLTERGKHPGILSYHGQVEGGGIRLEYARLHDLQTLVRRQSFDQDTIIRWMMQIADALAFVHDSGVIHGDVTAENVLLDLGLNPRLADFAGSSIDSSPLLVAGTAGYEYPGDLLSAKGDIFALGSSMYEVATGRSPYSGLSDGHIKSLLGQGEFPDVTSLGTLGNIIRTCWEGGYEDSKALVRATQGWCYPVSSPPAIGLRHVCTLAN